MPRKSKVEEPKPGPADRADMAPKKSPARPSGGSRRNGRKRAVEQDAVAVVVAEPLPVPEPPLTPDLPLTPGLTTPPPEAVAVVVSPPETPPLPPAPEVPPAELEAIGKRLDEVRRRCDGLAVEADTAGRQLVEVKADAEGVRWEHEEARRRLHTLRLQADTEAEEFERASREKTQTVARRAEELCRGLDELSTALEQGKAELQTVRSQAGEVREGWGRARTELEEVARGLGDLRRRTEELRGEIGKGAEQAREAAHLLEESRARLREAEEARAAAAVTPTVTPAPPLPPPGLPAPLTVTEPDVRAVTEPAPPAVEAPATEPAADAPPVVAVRARVETTPERVLRYLRDAQAVETEVADALEKMADEVLDPAAREVLAAQRDGALRQRDQLAGRIRALGGQPANGGNKGFFNRLVGAIWGALSRPGDDFDQATQHLMKAYASSQFQAAVYEALAAFAAAVTDGETALLAREHLQHERTDAEAVWPLLASAAEAAAAANVAVQQPEPEEE
jgi:ferritin-like metal-binding protein YciE